MAESIPAPGTLRRFILEHHPVRGHVVHMGDAWRELRAIQPYPAAVEALLGEAVTATVLLAATLKFEGKLTLQLSGNGLVKLLVAQCTHDFRVRATAQHDTPPLGTPFSALVGDGRLVVTIESGEAGRYQGIVPLAGDSMAACLETYFVSSEQLPTRLLLASDPRDAAGLLLQKLPASGDGEVSAAVTQATWEQLQGNLAGVTPAELLAQSAELLLPRVCAPHDCRLFTAAGVRFECSCSVQRVSELLRSIGETEARSVLAEQGAVTITCDFCGRPYRFDAVDVQRLFAGDAPLDVNQHLN